MRRLRCFPGPRRGAGLMPRWNSLARRGGRSRKVMSLLRAWFSRDGYRPERHYMRGGRSA